MEIVKHPAAPGVPSRWELPGGSEAPAMAPKEIPTELSGVEIPDAVGPIVGWRAWKVGASARYLTAGLRLLLFIPCKR